ncbi:MAG: hypothetical protein LBU73_02730 [Helicobacteraceae bacterium]|jgi:phosphatidylserine decarboxylase|nr:hypothetical protein [Helicobacteraceae bacterium]
MKFRTRTQFVAVEGFVWIAAYLAIGALTFAIGIETIAIVAFLFAGVFAWFFRNPERIPEESDPFVFIAPIDGKIIGVESKEDGVTLRIKNRLFDAHILRSPTQGLARVEARQGLIGDIKPSLKILRQSEKIFIGQSEISLAPSSQPSLIYPPREPCYLSERIGIFFGGVLETKLPKSAEMKIAVGNVVRAGETLLAARLSNTAE